MKNEIKIFLTAVMFFTRIPCPEGTTHSEEYLAKGIRYFSLIGIIVGGMGALVYLGALYIFDYPLAILLSMAATILITGAFHEDGLGDVCDGFGGGRTKEDILRIMKDSRIGTFSLIAVGGILALKFYALSSLFVYTSLLTYEIPFILIAGHSLSRFTAGTLLYSYDYVREEGKSKSLHPMDSTSLIISFVMGVAPLFLLLSYSVFLALIPMLLLRWYFGYLFFKKIGGYTGDCAGALQQICEVVFYLSLLAIWKFI